MIYGWKCLFEAQHSPCYIVDVKYLDRDILASSDAKDFSIKPFKELNNFAHYKTNISSGSFLEYLDVARLFNSSSSSIYAFIIRSLPGYGDSDAPVRTGMNPSQMACIMQNLMQYLSHSSYILALGHYINPSILLDHDEYELLMNQFNLYDFPKFLWQEDDYFHLQATKPDTIGYALNDLSIGLD